MAKKKSRVKSGIWLPVIGIIALCFSLVSINTASQNVLGTTISQGKQLQINWFKPTVRPSGASNQPTSSIIPTQSASPQVAQSFPPIQPSPPGNACNYGNGLLADPNNPSNPTCDCQAVFLRCMNGGPAGIGIGSNPSYQLPPLNPVQISGFCEHVQHNGVYCFGKPVIYLYPQTKTLVDVTVTVNGGSVIISDPLYDYLFRGWKGVEAYPDGSLIYGGKKYHELFYETSVANVKPPKNGLVMSSSQLAEQLLHFTAQLGLIGAEQAEFLDYWMPKLEALNSPYILVSLIDREQKDQIDRVTISPKPDVFINFLVYFKPLMESIVVEPLVLPKTPDRFGFTAVEWGGTIDSN